MRRSFVGLIGLVEILRVGLTGVAERLAEPLRRLENATSIRGDV
jgi:hypothetical protein